MNVETLAITSGNNNTLYETEQTETNNEEMLFSFENEELPSRYIQNDAGNYFTEPLVTLIDKILTTKFEELQAACAGQPEQAVKTLKHINHLLFTPVLSVEERLERISTELESLPVKTEWLNRVCDEIKDIAHQWRKTVKLKNIIEILRHDPLSDPLKNADMLLEFMPENIVQIVEDMKGVFDSMTAANKILNEPDVKLNPNEKWLKYTATEFYKAYGEKNIGSMMKFFFTAARDEESLKLIRSFLKPGSELTVIVNMLEMVSAEIRQTQPSAPLEVDNIPFIGAAWQSINVIQSLSRPAFIKKLEAKADNSAITTGLASVLRYYGSYITPDNRAGRAVDNMFELLRGNPDISFSHFIAEMLGSVDYWQMGKSLLLNGLSMMSAPVNLVAQLGYAAWNSSFINELLHADYKDIPFLAVNRLNQAINDPHSHINHVIMQFPLIGASLQLMLKAFLTLVDNALFKSDNWVTQMKDHLLQFAQQTPLAGIIEQLIKIGLVINLWRACRIGATDEDIENAQLTFASVSQWFPQDNFRFLHQVVDWIPLIRRIYDHAHSLNLAKQAVKKKGEPQLNWGMRMLTLLNGQGEKNRQEIIKTQQMLAEKIFAINLNALERASQKPLDVNDEIATPSLNKTEGETTQGTSPASAMSFSNPGHEKIIASQPSPGRLASLYAKTTDQLQGAQSALDAVREWASVTGHRGVEVLRHSANSTSEYATALKDKVEGVASTFTQSTGTTGWGSLSTAKKVAIIGSGALAAGGTYGIYKFIQDTRSRYNIETLTDDLLSSDNLQATFEEAERRLISVHKRVVLARGLTLGLGVLSFSTLAVGAGYRVWEYIDKNNRKENASHKDDKQPEAKHFHSVKELFYEQKKVQLSGKSQQELDAVLAAAISVKNSAGADLLTARESARLEGGSQAVAQSPTVASEKEAYELRKMEVEVIKEVIRKLPLLATDTDEQPLFSELHNKKALFRNIERAGLLTLAGIPLPALLWWRWSKEEAYLSAKINLIKDDNLRFIIELGKEEKRRERLKNKYGPIFWRKDNSEVHHYLDTSKVMRSKTQDYVGRKNRQPLNSSASSDTSAEVLDNATGQKTTEKGFLSAHSNQQTKSRSKRSLSESKISYADLDKELANLAEIDSKLSQLVSDHALTGHSAMSDKKDEQNNYLRYVNELLHLRDSLQNKVESYQKTAEWINPDYIYAWIQANTDWPPEKKISVTYRLSEELAGETKPGINNEKWPTEVKYTHTLEDILTPGFEAWRLYDRDHFDHYEDEQPYSSVVINWPSDTPDIVKKMYAYGNSENRNRHYSSTHFEDIESDIEIYKDIVRSINDISLDEPAGDTIPMAVNEIDNTLSAVKKLESAVAFLNPVKWIDRMIIKTGKKYNVELSPEDKMEVEFYFDPKPVPKATDHIKSQNTHTHYYEKHDIPLRDFLIYKRSKMINFVNKKNDVSTRMSSYIYPASIKKEDGLKGDLESLDFEAKALDKVPRLKNNRLFKKVMLSLYRSLIQESVNKFANEVSLNSNFDEKSKSAKKVQIAVSADVMDLFGNTVNILGRAHKNIDVPGLFAIPLKDRDNKKRALLISSVFNEVKLFEYIPGEINHTRNEEMWDFDLDTAGDPFIKTMPFSTEMDAWITSHLSAYYSGKSAILTKDVDKVVGADYYRRENVSKSLVSLSEEKFSLSEIMEYLFTSQIDKSYMDIAAIYTTAGEDLLNKSAEIGKIMMKGIAVALTLLNIYAGPAHPWILKTAVGLSGLLVLAPQIVTLMTADTQEKKQAAENAIIAWVITTALNITISLQVKNNLMPSIKEKILTKNGGYAPEWALKIHKILNARNERAINEIKNMGYKAKPDDLQLRNSLQNILTPSRSSSVTSSRGSSGVSGMTDNSYSGTGSPVSAQSSGASGSGYSHQTSVSSGSHSISSGYVSSASSAARATKMTDTARSQNLFAFYRNLVRALMFEFKTDANPRLAAAIRKTLKETSEQTK